MQFVLEIPKFLLEALLVVIAFLLAVFQLGTKEFPAAAATVALFLTAGFRVIPSMLRMQAAGTNMRRGIEGAKPTFRLADELRQFGVTALPPHEEPRAITRLREQVTDGHRGFFGSVELRHVNFTYPEASSPALVDISLTAKPGKSLALVGTTGAGKSTLADVILGVLEPDSGAVLISGVKPSEAVHTWAGAVSYVPQSVALVDGTVRQNVALGLPIDLVDDALVWAALEQAHLAEFLLSSREGLNTVVGERGVRFSGGQRQRLGIARALFTRPLILVMDEATSALDAETEDAITTTLGDLEGHVTTITVAHRLATVRFADELLFMRDGVIVARGGFEEVRAQEPDFARQAKLLGL
jgi:ABC-type multidrug transport system fused ATPase/permease subunit